MKLINYIVVNQEILSKCLMFIKYKTIKAEAGSNFLAKLIDCPVYQKNFETNQNPDSVLQIISDSAMINKNLSSSINNPPLLYTKIYPNPSEGKITIEFVGKIDRNIKIEIISSMGELVYSKDNITTTNIDIDISNLSRGIYILKGTFGINSVYEKIILK